MPKISALLFPLSWVKYGLSRDLNIHTETYSLLLQKLEETNIKEASKLSKIRIVDYATPNYQRISPNRKANLTIGLFFGLFVGLIGIYIYEIFDNTIGLIW